MSAHDTASSLNEMTDTFYTLIAKDEAATLKIGRILKPQAREVDDWVHRGVVAATTEDKG